MPYTGWEICISSVCINLISQLTFSLKNNSQNYSSKCYVGQSNTWKLIDLWVRHWLLDTPEISVDHFTCQFFDLMAAGCSEKRELDPLVKSTGVVLLASLVSNNLYRWRYLESDAKDFLNAVWISHLIFFLSHAFIVVLLIYFNFHSATWGK